MIDSNHSNNNTVDLINKVVELSMDVHCLGTSQELGTFRQWKPTSEHSESLLKRAMVKELRRRQGEDDEAYEAPAATGYAAPEAPPAPMPAPVPVFAPPAEPEEPEEAEEVAQVFHEAETPEQAKNLQESQARLCFHMLSHVFTTFLILFVPSFIIFYHP